jgi:hypothetical protein
MYKNLIHNITLVHPEEVEGGKNIEEKRLGKEMLASPSLLLLFYNK